MKRVMLIDEYADAAGALRDGSAVGWVSPTASMSVQRRRRLAIAAIAAISGLIAIVAGYIGVSGTRVISDQLSYIASGSMVGLFLVAISGALVIADYMAEQSRVLNEVRAYLEALVYDSHVRNELGSRGAFEATVVGRTVDEASTTGAARGGELVILPGSRRVHRADCQMVVGKGDVRRVEHVADGMRPCRVCKPDLVDEAVTAP